MSYSKRLMVWSSEVNILLDVNNVADQNLSRFSCQLEMLTPLFIHSSFYIFFCFLYFFLCFFVFLCIFLKYAHSNQILSMIPSLSSCLPWPQESKVNNVTCWEDRNQKRVEDHTLLFSNRWVSPGLYDWWESSRLHMESLTPQLGN